MKKGSREITVGLLSAILIIAMVFSGCRKSGASKVVVWTNLENEVATLKKYGDMWSKETGNKVDVIHETADLQQFAQAVRGADGPDALFGIANDQLANYVSAGMAQEVPDDVYKNEDYVDAAVQACYSNGKRYAVPIAVETNALFYNTQKIKKAPQTWDELIDLAKAKGGIKFDATSIYYDLAFYAPMAVTFLNTKMVNMMLPILGLAIKMQ